ncbi:MAG TPA: carboxypeptidase-like regulatory domain-containing protein [Pyrinomonadaceae bacterium]|nr:carboxypeptidase-like regulatory domain-containing protein [Pyrinomonadaceae bacterium]
MHKNFSTKFVGIFVLAFLFNLSLTFNIEAAVSQIGTSDSATLTDTLNFTVPAGANRVLIVIASDADATGITSVSFGGTPLVSQVQHTDGTAVDSMWTLSLGTSVSSTNQNITVVTTGSTPNSLQFIGAIAFEGVDQATPLTGIQTADSFGSNVGSSLTVSSKPSDVVLDIFDTFDYNFGGTRTPGINQAVQHSQSNVFIGLVPTLWEKTKNSTSQLGTVSYGFYNTSTKPGSASVNMSWTSDDIAMIHIAANVNSLAPTAASASISGKAVTADGRGIKNAQVYLIDQNGNVRTALTNSFGNYVFENVSAGENYVLNIFAKKFHFTNPTRLINVQNDVSDEDFVSEAQ